MNSCPFLAPRSHRQRLERWAELLERTPERALGTLAGTEHRVAATRDTMRGAGSPITVAFDDPLLRSEGLKDDTNGGAKRFFQMTDWQFHEIICDCQSGSTMKAARAARSVRAVIGGKPGFFARLRNEFVL